jgi:hypothetical protein
VPIIVVLVLLAIDVWIYFDAKRQAQEGAPVVFTWGSLRVDRPGEWLVGCLLLSIIFVPLYFTGRRH